MHLEHPSDRTDERSHDYPSAPREKHPRALRDLQAVIANCRFEDWELYVGLSPEGRMYLQCRMTQPCSKTGEIRQWAGRKWFLSPYMTKSELVQTACKAVLTAVEHEAREKFLYRGRAIFGPHYDVDRLWEMSTQENEETWLR